MIRHRFLCTAMAGALLFVFAGCAVVARLKPPSEVNLAAEIVQGERPAGPEGACWARDETPAIIETVTEQTALEASVTQDAGYLTQTRQKIVQQRAQIWFRTPCDADLTPAVLATLQRALTARGYYAGDASGTLDPATRAAIRAYQTPRGLNSDRLSLAAARDLGVIAADFGQDAPE